MHCKCIWLTLIHIWRECVFSAPGHNGLIKARGRAKVTGFVSIVRFQSSLCELCGGATDFYSRQPQRTLLNLTQTQESIETGLLIMWNVSCANHDARVLWVISRVFFCSCSSLSGFSACSQIICQNLTLSWVLVNQYKHFGLFYCHIMATSSKITDWSFYLFIFFQEKTNSLQK